MTVLKLEQVQKSFGAVVALKPLSLDLREGEFFALLGPSGCGKTTLLRIAAGFETPDEGRVFIDGQDVTALRASRRPVNLMFQSYALFPHLSVYENVAYGLKVEGLRGRDLESKVGEALNMVGLTGEAQRKPDALSGGQRQRVALARALVKRPRVLLLDEPLAALDKKLRVQMQIELKRLQHEVGTTFVVVTHDQEEALGLADRIALMKDGALAQIGSPKELYERPHSRFVADFIGSSNLLDGKVQGGQFSAAQGTLTCPVVAASDGPGALLLRPENLHLSLQSAGTALITGEVTGTAYFGLDQIIEIAVAGLPQNLTARLRGGDSITLGQRIGLNWGPEQSHFIPEDQDER